MDALQFLNMAEWLLNDPNYRHPAGFRTAIGRAYYAAHHFAKGFIEAAGVIVLKSAGGHADVCLHLKGTGDAIIEVVGSNLFDLQSNRNDADYNLNDRRIQNEATAKVLVALARDLIDRLQECHDDPDRCAKVKNAIGSRHRTLRGLS
jgi:uncharacterized protein (UPF0332 family)